MLFVLGCMEEDTNLRWFVNVHGKAVNRVGKPQRVALQLPMELKILIFSNPVATRSEAPDKY